MSTDRGRFSVVLRISCSVLAGIAVSGIAYICAWQNLRSMPAARYPQVKEQYLLRDIGAALDRHILETGAAPGSLLGLNVDTYGTLVADESGEVCDSWGNPYQYRADGDEYVLFSYGRDGRADGVGRDADLYSDGRNLQESLPTFRQFAAEPNMRQVAVICVLAGVFTFGLCIIQGLKTSKDAAQPRLGPGAFMVRIMFTALGCSVVGVVMTILHAPSGH